MIATDLFRIHDSRDYLLRAIEPVSKFVERIYQEHHTIVNMPIAGTCNYRKCWDISRVRLLTSKGDSDFIHANYVSGFDYVKKFIVTQDPLASTLDDYWNMVWQEETKVIVMLNDIDTTAASFDSKDSALKGFIITVESIILESYYVETIMNVFNVNAGELRTVHHFKYLNWVKGSITNILTLLYFLTIVNKKQQRFLKEAISQHPRPGPIIVYSSSGTGRAATFCAVDICVYQLINTASISVPSIITKIRQQIHSSIECFYQYIFINNVVVFFLSTALLYNELYFELKSHFSDKDIYLISLSLM